MATQMSGAGRSSSKSNDESSSIDWAPYGRLAAMVATSMAVMYVFMYLNVFEFAHVEWSETRAYMTLMMGAAMTVIMLGFMWSMFSSARFNVAVIVAMIAVFSGSLWLVRSQATVGDASYMRAMIPHHSIAILTSERAAIVDPRVSALADDISAAQRREIQEMNWLIDDINDNGVAATEADASDRPVPDFEP